MSCAEDVDRVAEGDHRHADDCGDEDDQRREQEDPLVGRGRNQVFLAEQLDAVRERLQQAVRTGPRRSHAVLHRREHLALVVGHVRHADQQDVHDQEGDDEIEPERHIRHACFPLPLPGFPNPALIRDVRLACDTGQRNYSYAARQAQATRNGTVTGTVWRTRSY